MKTIKRFVLGSALALTVAVGTSGVTYAQPAPVDVQSVVDVAGTIPLWIAALVAIYPLILSFKMGIKLANKALGMLFSGGAKVRA